MAERRRLLSACAMSLVVALTWLRCGRAEQVSFPREFLPPDASVVAHLWANVDPTPDKEWVVACNRPAAHEPHEVVVLGRRGDGWVTLLRALTSGLGILELEPRDLDADGVLEVIVWSETEDAELFETLAFVDGRLRLLKGLDVDGVWRGAEAGGFFDVDGDRELEFVIAEMVPGYLTAMHPGRKRVFSPYDAPETSDLDVRFYRFVKGSPVLYFPPARAVPTGLNRGLVSGYSRSRQAAAAAVGVLGVGECLPRLLTLLTDREEHVAWTAAQALGRLGGPLAIAALIGALQDNRPLVVQEVAVVLSRLTDEDAVRAVLELRGSADPYLRSIVVDVLARQGGPEAMEALRAYLHDETAWVSEAAQEALRRLEGGEAPAPEPADDDEDYDRWPAVVRHLLRTGGPDAVVALRRLLADADRLAGRGVTVAHAARWALVELGQPDAQALVLELSRAGDGAATLRLAESDDPLARREVLRALREGDPETYDAREWGETMLPDSAWGPGEGWFRKTARQVGEAAVPILIARLKEVAPWERTGAPFSEGEERGSIAIAAAHCLRELGAVEAIPALLEVAASHPNRTAREVATWAVVALRRQDADADRPLFRPLEQKPLSDYLGPGGPWTMVASLAADLDSDPEAELIVAYRHTGMSDPCDRRVEHIACLDWQAGRYVRAATTEYSARALGSLRAMKSGLDGGPLIVATSEWGINHESTVLQWQGGTLRSLGSIAFDGHLRAWRPPGTRRPGPPSWPGSASAW